MVEFKYRKGASTFRVRNKYYEKRWLQDTVRIFLLAIAFFCKLES